MKKTLLAFAFLMAAATSAQAGTKFCKDGGGSGELTIKGSKLTIKTQGLGESDGVLNFIDMKKTPLNAEWIENYSEYLLTPLASGDAYEGKIDVGTQTAPAKIYVLKTKPDTKGKVHHALMVSLAGGPPDLIGADTNCK